MKVFYLLIVVFFIIASCNRDQEIKSLLNDQRPYENIEGAYKAMKSDDLIYVPLLLKNSGKQEATTALQFKGVSVYEESMYALQHLLKINAPNRVTDLVDSVNVKFFINYWQNYKSGKKTP